jgi:hypothetical protein
MLLHGPQDYQNMAAQIKSDVLYFYSLVKNHIYVEPLCHIHAVYHLQSKITVLRILHSFLLQNIV